MPNICRSNSKFCNTNNMLKISQRYLRLVESVNLSDPKLIRTHNLVSRIRK